MIGDTVRLVLVILINVSTCIASHQNTKTTSTADLTTNHSTYSIPSDSRSSTVSSVKTELTSSDIFSTTDGTVTSSEVKYSDSTTSTRNLATRTTTANTYSPYFPSETPESTTWPSNIILVAGASLIKIDLNVSIEKPFSPDLTNYSSTEYKITSDAFLQTLTIAFGTMPSFSGITIEQFRNGSIVCDFRLFLHGNANLTPLEEAFDRSLKYLENVTVFGNLVEFQSAYMKAAFSQAAEKQSTGDVCEVYVDIIYCKWGYTCHRALNGTIICTLDCSSLSTSCLNNGGTCVFDRKNNQSICLCTIDACWNDAHSLNTETIVAIVFGVIGTVLMVLIPVGIEIYKRRKTPHRTVKEVPASKARVQFKWQYRFRQWFRRFTGSTRMKNYTDETDMTNI